MDYGAINVTEVPLDAPGQRPAHPPMRPSAGVSLPELALGERFKIAVAGEDVRGSRVGHALPPEGRQPRHGGGGVRGGPRRLGLSRGA